MHLLALTPHPATGTDPCPLHCWGIPKPPQKGSELSQQGAQPALMLRHCQPLSSTIKISVSCPHYEIHPPVTLKWQQAKKMLTNLPVSGEPQDFPMNGKDLSYSPCPKGAGVKKFAIPHRSIYALPLLCPNPHKAWRGGAQETVKVNLSKGASTQSPRDEEMARCISARQKTQQGTVNSAMAHGTANTCVPSPLPGELCGTFWLQQSDYQLFAHFPLMNHLNETSVSVRGVKVCHSAVCKLWPLWRFLDQISGLQELFFFWGRCHLSTKPTALINLIPQVSVWITAMCGWPQNKLKNLLHGIRLKGWPAWELDLFFNTRAQSKT